MAKLIPFLFLLLYSARSSFGQAINIAKSIDSLLAVTTKKPFNGIVLVAQNETIVYSRVYGLADIDNKIPLKLDDQFVIGSISKQITAVLVLREYEKGHLQLNVPIHTYLPEMSETWADSVTVQQLLTHTHGITERNRPLAFPPGTQYLYSQIGYDLLAKIIEKTSRKSFALLSRKLFKRCQMKHTFHPDMLGYKNLVNGYTEQRDGNLVIERGSLENYPAAGTFISTAGDLLRWNNCLHTGQVLADSTYKMMITEQPRAIRQHPLFGTTAYGYGITISKENAVLQLGQTGFAPGFISMDFYFPATKTSIIVLDNMVWNSADLKKAFSFPLQLLKIVRSNQ